MNLPITRREFISHKRDALKMWLWLAAHPGSPKCAFLAAYPDYPDYTGDCACCDICDCRDCPLGVIGDGCMSSGHPYREWYFHGFHSKPALEIVSLLKSWKYKE